MLAPVLFNLVFTQVLLKAVKVLDIGAYIGLGKTQLLVQPAPNTMRPKPAITIDRVQLKRKEILKYLGRTISAGGSLDEEIPSRIQKASQAFGRLRKKVLQQKLFT
ncbi:hypothetical protein RRG08_009084 [Elysia crispata]|uniref:Uncharacterized protein n=1 Tax=Elysia crispata TaxID=231223 RepID=A0AAE1CU76_9GAST|nr:hypothetical protein RRG08_009084 [Elysia crispata]